MKQQQIIASLIIAAVFVVIMAIAITKFAEIMKEHPELLWLITGIGVAIVIQGIVWGIYLLWKRSFHSLQALIKDIVAIAPLRQASNKQPKAIKG